MNKPSTPNNPTHFKRLPLLALGIIALIAGLWAGIARLGLVLPGAGDLAVFHGPLMVSGFLGTVIGIERAVALKHLWAYTAPALAGLAVIGLIAGLPNWPAPLLMSASSGILILIFMQVLRIQFSAHSLIMAGGALAWLIGNILWLYGFPFYSVVYWWLGFLVLTIVGERLDLNRLLPPSRWTHISFRAALGIFVFGLLLTVISADLGARLLGLGELTLAIWLLHFDIARRNLRQIGLIRFIAASLYAGHLWLGIAGGLTLFYGATIAGPAYDAVLHAVFVGFVFSMIFGHAPIIFPAILGIHIEYNPRFYLHLALLHSSLLIRIVADIGNWFTLRQWGGALNAAAILLFLLNTGLSVRLRR